MTSAGWVNSPSGWATVVLAGVWLAAGCQSAPADSTVLAATRATPALQTAPATQSAQRQLFRVATAKDLQVILFATKDDEHHFPNSIVKIYNAADEDVIVVYEPGSVVVHCGDYQKEGPPVTFVRRREILSPHQPLELAIPPGGWTRTNAAGEHELMLPTDLPAGRYELWASFRVEGDAVIESRHEGYDVP
jgi:hypothetical protein